MKRCHASALAFGLVSFTSAPAQTTAPAVKHPIETSVSLGVGAQLTATRVASQPYFGTGSQGLDPSATLLANVRQSFAPWLGYSVSVGYFHATEQAYGAAVNSGYGFIANGTSHVAFPFHAVEVSVAYLAERHLSRSATAFASLGGGFLQIVPAGQTTPARSSNNSFTALTRPMGLASTGIDFRLNRRLDLRAEYRGLLYKYPDHNAEFARKVTETSQPTLSLVYHFGARP